MAYRQFLCGLSCSVDLPAHSLARNRCCAHQRNGSSLPSCTTTQKKPEELEKHRTVHSSALSKWADRRVGAVPTKNWLQPLSANRARISRVKRKDCKLLLSALAKGVRGANYMCGMLGERIVSASSCCKLQKLLEEQIITLYFNKLVPAKKIPEKILHSFPVETFPHSICEWLVEEGTEG
eukprot:1152897-Pelagomonas_calceolata.AAC.7